MNGITVVFETNIQNPKSNIQMIYHLPTHLHPVHHLNLDVSVHPQPTDF